MFLSFVLLNGLCPDSGADCCPVSPWATVQADGGGGHFGFGLQPPWLNLSPAAAHYCAVEVLGLLCEPWDSQEGILCPLQAEQSSYIAGEPGDTRLARANPNIQFKMLRNDNQMSKACVSAPKSSGLRSKRRLWRL